MGNRSQTVLVLLSNHYSHDPRVRRQCKTLASAGYNVTVLAWDRTGGDYPARESLDGVIIRRVAIASTPDTGMRQLKAMLRFWIWSIYQGLHCKASIVHCHDLDTTLPGILVGRLKRAAIIFDAHEHFSSQIQITSSQRVANLANLLERFVVPRVNAVITVGQRLGDFMRNEGAKEVTIVHNSYSKIDFDFSPELISNWRTALRLSDKSLVISYLGVLTKTRYIDVLLEAVAQHPEVSLLLAGQGPLKHLVKDYAQRHPNIIYAGMVPERLVALLTCVSDVIFCCFDPNDPNNYFSMPNKFFQALAAAKPCIATRGVGELGDWIEKYELGAIIPNVTVSAIGEALENLKNPATVACFRANAEQAFIGQGFSWDVSQQNLLFLYEKLALHRR